MASVAPILGSETTATDEGSVEFIWQQFNSQFPTETDCVEHLCRCIAKDGLKCHRCGSSNIERKRGDRAFMCLNCNKKSWFTAGTFFHKIKRVRHWLGAMWLMEHGVTVNSWQLHKLIGSIVYSTALTMFKKLTTVILSRMGEKGIDLFSACFVPVFCKRSRETPAREHPVAEQEEVEKQWLENERATQLSDESDASAASSTVSASLKQSCSGENLRKTRASTCIDTGQATLAAEFCGTEQHVYELLSADPVDFDSLCEQANMPVGDVSSALAILEIKGLALRKSGDQYVRIPPPVQVASGRDSPAEIEAKTRTVTDIIGFILLNFRGISRKYLQNYLAAYWCRLDRARWHQGSLIKECLRFGAIGYREILAYVSPPVVMAYPFCPSEDISLPPGEGMSVPPSIVAAAAATSPVSVTIMT